MLPKAFRNSSFFFNPLKSLLRPNIFCFSYQKYKFADVVNIFNKFSNEKRSEIVTDLNEILTKSLKNCDKETNFNLIRLLICKMNNTGSKTKMGLGDKLLTDIIAKYFCVSVAKATEDFKKFGEIGLLASHYFLTEKKGEKIAEELDINFVSKAMGEIYTFTGKGSLERKALKLLEIMKRCSSADEIKFLFRILKGELKIGLGEASVIKALNDIKDSDIPIKMSDFMADLQMEVFKRSISEEKNSVVKPGLPIVLMAGRPAESIETLIKFQTLMSLNGNVICEYKYDGERSQIHYANGTIQAFSRAHENQTEKYRNLLAKLKAHFESLKIVSCIIDCELVGFDYEKNKVLEFQDFRKKKEFGPNDLEAKIYAFDVIYWNEKILLNEPLIYRKGILNQIPQVPFFEQPTSFSINLFEEEYPMVEQAVLAFLHKSIEEGYEGIMVKTIDEKLSHYDGKTRTLWTKLKKNALQGGLPDSFDLVPIGAYWGKGRKSGHFSSFLLATFNKDTKKFEPLCRLGSGFTDEMLTMLTFKLQNTILKEKPTIYETTKELPDQWLAPTQVWEVYSDSFSQSDYYSVGKTSLKKGISLRFPRFSRFRDDKTLFQLTTSQDLVDLFVRIEQNKLKKEDK